MKNTVRILMVAATLLLSQGVIAQQNPLKNKKNYKSNASMNLQASSSLNQNSKLDDKHTPVSYKNPMSVQMIANQNKKSISNATHNTEESTKLFFSSRNYKNSNTIVGLKTKKEDTNLAKNE
jgi:hypothetical protein